MYAMVFSEQPCSFQARVNRPLNHFRLFSYVSSSNIHNPMQKFLSYVHFGPVGHLFQKNPIKRNEVGLHPEISVATVLDHDDQSNDFHNADSSKP
jgi:hypothetical protein